MFKYVFINNNKQVKNVILCETDEELDDEMIRAQEDLFGEELHVRIVDADFTVGPGRIDYQGWEFRLPRPYPSWLYDEVLGEWRSPIPHPLALEGNWDAEDEGGYIWDESVVNWVLTP